MSNLISTYEISVWKDIMINGEFVEQKICVIGSDTMDYQGKAIEPQLIRKANGEKKLTFSMYKQFTDHTTGLKVTNPFSDFLFNEQKVKLWYEDKWYDFIVKNVEENSSTYLYKYSLEDALVQELSKNGFDVTFDVGLMNNLGTAEELGTLALENTDWSVEADLFTELVEDNLVYVINSNSFEAQRIYAEDGDITQVVTETIPENSILLAFYSSCKNKPHRFQFIYLNNDDYDEYNRSLVLTDENRIITLPNCQYYVDINKTSKYQSSSDFYVPEGMSVVVKGTSTIGDEYDTTISNWYRGKRYGYAQKTQYIPLLEKYCNLFHKVENSQIETVDGKPVIYYGYAHTEFTSPLYTSNLITNSDFQGTAGWVGSYYGNTPNQKSRYGAEITPMFGHFVDGEFVSAEEVLKNGTFEPGEYSAYLKLIFPDDSRTSQENHCFVMNSGFYDKRMEINNVQAGDKWRLDISMLVGGTKLTAQNIADKFQIKLQEVKYNSRSGNHTLDTMWGSYSVIGGKGYITISSTAPSLTPEKFQKRNIKIIISPRVSGPRECYLEDIKMYKEVQNEKGENITPEDFDVSGVMAEEYHFVADYDLKDKKTIDEVKVFKMKAVDLDYDQFIPLYNNNAEKVRTISMKESNYFNILQSISETFEAWLELEVKREDESNPGRITSKKVKFKKYLGSENYAAFRYGVNLKDIKRTFESKGIVSKLIVKHNVNELAPQGYCTISRAKGNPIGEDCIYDFRYYHNMGMLPPLEYVAQMYYATNPINGEVEYGQDVNSNHIIDNTNAQNFINRLKRLNEKYQKLGEERDNLDAQAGDIKADIEVQTGIVSQSEEGIEETRDEFYILTGFYPEEINSNPFDKIEMSNGSSHPTNANWQNLGNERITAKRQGSETSTDWTFDVDLCPTYNETIELPSTVSNSDSDSPLTNIVAFGETTLASTTGGFTMTCQADSFCGAKICPSQYGYTKGKFYEMSYTLTVTGGTLTAIGSHGHSFKDLQVSIDGGRTFVKNTTVTLSPKTSGSINVVVRGTYYNNPTDATNKTNYLFIQPNRGVATAVNCTITKLTMKAKKVVSCEKAATYSFSKIFTMYRGDDQYAQAAIIKCTIPGYSLQGKTSYSLTLIDVSGSTLSNLLTEYVTWQQKLKEATDTLGDASSGLTKALNSTEDRLKELNESLKSLTAQKNALNKAFYKKYSRFITEGTWISEEYVDHDKYYNDALSVLYNSCYPQVVYSINVFAVGRLPGYEGFKFQLGDKTHAVDPDFFGTEEGIEVVITEQTDHLDSPEKNSVKVQNFKNQFQDLFQKITATVQSVQYSTGSYEKAAALADADVQLKGKFVTEALTGMSGKLAVAGQTTVVQDQSGITLTDSNTRDQMRLIGGAILMSVEDSETGERKWKTGLTPEGISASLITAGTLNAGKITIMNGEEPVFRWDAFGISAFDIDWINGDISGTTNPYKFVRFDKYGIYGIDQESSQNGAIDGRSWKPTSIDEIDQLATFALTWQGLKVTGTQGVARIGRQSNNIIEVVRTKEDGSTIKTFTVDNNGHVTIKGSLTILDEDDDEEDWSEIIGDGFVKIDSTIGNNTTSFKVSSKGLLTAKNAWITGTIYATEGEIGGWKLKSGNLYKGDLNKKGGYYLITQNLDTAISVAGSSEFSDWRLVIGDSFGVDSWGNLYAKDVRLEGTITATGGKIGSWQITEEGIATTKDIKTLYTGAFLLATSARGNKVNDLVEMGNERYFMGVRALVAGGWDAASDDPVAVTAFAVADTGYMRSIHGRIGPWYYGFHSLSNTNNFRDKALINDACSLLFPTQIVARQKTTTDWYAAGWYDIAWWVGWLTANKTALTTAYTYKPTTTTI